ncbi:TPA: hypothetical protein U1617_002384 [Streptococcus suis]|uniref:hypothetical protein n=1 Tax=Streptococcus suis TaxID=1307 RepID=UPI0009456823|nr:hypothetical protein [Streptococcus suis]MDW8651096.1 hypothetical protein [Streptococcus suis]NQO84728.1 hypothetical protein [Streptococcus suis]HEM5490390.1 hypothetical protein [Streptococcus suis]HEM5491753.1 hypothetical protein [Streptococcus suis]
MAKDFMLQLALESLSKCLSEEWRESDEVILFSFANKEQITQDERYRETEKCNYFGKRICIFASQIKKNNYITLHKSMLTNIVEIMEKNSNQKVEEDNE